MTETCSVTSVALVLLHELLFRTRYRVILNNLVITKHSFNAAILKGHNPYRKVYQLYQRERRLLILVYKSGVLIVVVLEPYGPLFRNKSPEYTDTDKQADHDRLQDLNTCFRGYCARHEGESGRTSLS